MRFWKSAGLIASAIMAIGCGNDDDPVNPNATLRITLASGNSQPGVVGRPVTDLLVAKVTNAADQPVEGKTVTWSVSAGGGSVNPTTSLTDAAGLASTTLTLGPTEIANSVTASVAGQQSATVVFTANARYEEFFSSMNGANENPPLTNSAIGSATYRVRGDSVDFTVVASGLTGTFGGLHIHAPRLTNPGDASIAVDLCPVAAACALVNGSVTVAGTFGPASVRSHLGAIDATAGQRLDSLLATMRKSDGTAYTNLHTSINRGGQARGAIVVRPPFGTTGPVN